MGFDVQQERHRQAIVERMSPERREDQQRQPRDQNDDDDAPAQATQRRIGEAHPAQHREQQPPLDHLELR